MVRYLATLSLALVAAAAFAQPGARPTALYAEGFGAAGLYAFGVERAVWAFAEGHHLRLRVGVSDWSDEYYSPVDRLLTDHVVSVPVGASALFSIGRPLGVPLAFETGAGLVGVRRSGPRLAPDGPDYSLDPYAEVAVRTLLLGRVGLRAGLTFGGEESSFSGDVSRPVVGVSFGF